MKSRLRASSLLFYGINTLVAGICIVSFINAISWINKPFAGFLIYKFSLVGSMSSRDWPGIQAGLKLMDRIIAVDERSIREGRDVEAIVKGKASGALIPYAVESKGEVRKVTVPTTTFSFYDFVIVFLVPFLGGLALFCLGFIAYFLKPNVSTSWVFFLSCLFVGIYMVTGFEIQSTYLFVNLHYLIIPLMPATLFHLGSIFPEKKRFLTRHPKLEYLIYLPALVLAVLYELHLFTFLRVSSTHLLSWIPDNKDIANVTRVFTPLCIASMIIMILHSMFSTSLNIVRQRARMILFGVTIAFLLPVLITFVVYFMKVTFPINFLVFLVIFFPASIAYSIIRHNLFDADAIIRRTVGYVLVTAVVVAAYVGVSVLLNVFLGKYQLAQSSAFPIIFTLAIILIFNPLRNRIQLLVDKIFFRKEYDFGEIVNRIGDTITSSLDLGHILKQIMKTFTDDMFIDTSSVMLLNPARTGYQVYLADGEKKEVVEQIVLDRNKPLSQVIVKEKKELTKYDVLEDPKYKVISEDCSKEFENLRASLVVPLVFQNEVTGLFSLGEKKSGKFYNREDINFLRTLARQGAVALENARLFQENIEKSRMEEELKIAHNLQTSMLPDRAPIIEGFSIVARSIPAREVGGDFYDFIEITEKGVKRLGIVVGDVSGKAVSGALVMAASRSIFRVLTETHESVEEVMNRANVRLQRDVKKGMFVALLYAVLNPEKKTLTLSNAGQIQPILCSSGKPKPEYIDSEGDRFPLGIVKDCQYQETRVLLKQGDILVFSTDGIVEAVNEKGELYGFERFLKSIEEGRGLNPDELLEKIIKDVTLYVGKVEQHDDLTAVVLKVD
jgi:serine phosphatase RsbU (regulator of sigma subunit)/preprotein translocase subunit SecE